MIFTILEIIEQFENKFRFCFKSYDNPCKTLKIYKMVQITHWYTWTRGKMTVMATPSSNGSMPKHCWLGWRWSWIRDFSRTIITNINIFDKPLERIRFNHRWCRSWLNRSKTVDSRTKTVTGIGSNSISFSHNRWTTGKSWLSCPNFVLLFWNFWGFDL